MKKKKNLPTLEANLGGILDNHKPRLERFIKNKKQKQILIGTIIGIIVLIGGITLYHTFAMYKTEKSFDVIQGKVPDFLKDLTDFEKLVRIIKSNAKNYDELFANDEDVQKMVESEDAMQLVVQSKEIKEEMKKSSYYQEKLVPKLLDCTLVDNMDKFNAGLPAYLYKEGEEYTELTGGWEMVTIKNPSVWYMGDHGYGSLTKNKDNLELSVSSSYEANSKWVATQNYLDLSSFTRLASDVHYYSKYSSHNSRAGGVNRSTGFYENYDFTSTTLSIGAALSFYTEENSTITSTTYDKRDNFYLTLQKASNSRPLFKNYTYYVYSTAYINIYKVWVE